MTWRIIGALWVLILCSWAFIGYVWWRTGISPIQMWR